MLSAQNPSELPCCHTGRLVLRRPREEDLDAAIAIHGDPATNRFNPLGPATPDMIRTALKAWDTHWHQHGFGYWSVSTLAEPDRIIGFGGIMLKTVVDEEALNLYFRFTPRAWGQGYATELGEAAIHSAFNLLGFDEVRATVLERNLPSRAAVGRLGLVQTRAVPGLSPMGPNLVFSLRKP